MNTRMILVAALALSSTLATACKKAPTASTETPDAAAPAGTVALPSAPADGGGMASGVPTGPLKDYFPKDGAGGYKCVIRANRVGYTEAALEKDGKEVAVISIIDAERLAYAKAKFENATEKLQGFPLLMTGKDLSSLLVRDRFEIKVLSKTLDGDARKAILATFDLKGLGT